MLLRPIDQDSWKEIVRFAWEVSPRLAVQMNARFLQPVVHRELHRLIANNTLDAVDVPEALVILLGDRLLPNAKLDLKHLQYWAPVPAITAANYFLPQYGNHPLILQYAMRCLEYYPIELVFFYIPQIVQALRHDELGYVEKYIMEAGQASQLFAHQIIWNMQANFYVDADKECVKVRFNCGFLSSQHRLTSMNTGGLLETHFGAYYRQLGQLIHR